MNRKNLYGLSGGAILSVVGLLAGFFLGVNIGGNYFPDFVFMGGRGYEATGYLGAIIGAVIGVVLGVFLGIKYSAKAEKDKSL